MCVRLAVLCLAPLLVCATNPDGFPNSLGRKPLLGWRSWNLWRNDDDFTQNNVELQMNAITMRRRPPPGSFPNTPRVSLQDLGYSSIGLDDGWQACGTGVNGSFHNASGWPLVNFTRFPDLAAMNAKAHAMGLTSHFYVNNCGCNERGRTGTHYTKDPAFAASLEFDGIKVDGCGPSPNITAWAAGANATGRPLLIENCNDNDPFRPTADNCPYNMFRSSGDNAPSLLSGISNLLDTVPYLSVARPGCFAYPDMLEIGAPLAGTPTACGPRMSFAESRAEFAGWAAVSSPLVLGFDMANTTEYDTWWPIIANTEVLAINQAWAGSAGRLVAMSKQNFTANYAHGSVCEVKLTRSMPEWTVWGKPLPSASFAFAAVAINAHATKPLTMSLPLSALGFAATDKVNARDVHLHKDLGTVSQWDIVNLAPHDSVFIRFEKQA